MGSMCKRSIWLHTAYFLLSRTVSGILQHTKHVQPPLEKRGGRARLQTLPAALQAGCALLRGGVLVPPLSQRGQGSQ